MIRKCFITILLVFAATVAVAQDGEEDMQLLETKSRITGFIEELQQLAVTLNGVSDDNSWQQMDRQLNTLDVKWDTYMKAWQLVIAEDDSALTMASQFQQLRKVVDDSLQVMKHRSELLVSFHKAEAFIAAQDTAYKGMYTMAIELSLVKATAPQLEKLKVKEQLLFADVTLQYNNAKAAAAEIPSLKKLMATVEDNYINLKNQSEKIQAAKYEPFFERIKNWLFGFAAVTIILMFFSMVQSKLQMLKQARENARKYKQMLGQDNDDYPTI